MQTDEILSKLRERIVAYAAFHLSRDLAEDVAQEVMLLLHTKYGNVSAADDLVPLAIENAAEAAAADLTNAYAAVTAQFGFCSSLNISPPSPPEIRPRLISEWFAKSGHQALSNYLVYCSGR